jgi:hypothetical protein
MGAAITAKAAETAEGLALICRLVRERIPIYAPPLVLL